MNATLAQRFRDESSEGEYTPLLRSSGRPRGTRGYKHGAPSGAFRMAATNTPLCEMRLKCRGEGARCERFAEDWLRARRKLLGAFAAVDEEEDGHANGQAIGDLFEDQGATAIGDFAVDFD